MNPGHHTYGICTLSLSDTPLPFYYIKLLTNFFFKTKFCVSPFCLHVCLYFMCAWCPQNPEEHVDSLELKFQMVVIYHVTENQARALSKKCRAVIPAPTLTSCLYTYLVYNLKLRQKTQCSSGIWATEKEEWKTQGWSEHFLTCHRTHWVGRKDNSGIFNSFASHAWVRRSNGYIMFQISSP